MPRKKHLPTVDAVIDFLGGTAEVARRTGNRMQTISNWRRNKVFPASSYITVQDELRRAGGSAPDSLWRMRGL